jgi:succinate dehydrogenase / fumarate reductase membrane anchor subunit
MHGVQRPLSPYWIYRWEITMWLSSLHRITGLLLSLGAVVLAAWLFALASGPEAFGRMAGVERRSALELGCGLWLRSAAHSHERPIGHRRDDPCDGGVLVRRDHLEGASMSLMTPLNRVLGLGTAKGAAEHWWLQRLTAVALLPLGLWFAYGLLTLRGFDYASVAAWVREPVTSILLILLVVAVGYHSALGVQVVIEDYVTGKGSKAATLMASTLAHVGLSVAAVFAVLKIAFGS